MDTIWKVQLDIHGKETQEFDLPAGAQFLSAQVQGEYISIWALVNIDNPPKTRRIKMIGTGQSIESHSLLKFIDTVQFFGGNLVLHLFEV